MVRIRVGGIEVEVESVADAAELIAALGERGAARLLPAAVAEPKADTRVGPPAPRTAPVAKNKGGRPAKWSAEDVAGMHARFKGGERLEDIGADHGLSYHALRQLFLRHNLPLKFARGNPVAAVPVKKLAPGASGLEGEKGSYRRVG